MADYWETGMAQKYKHRTEQDKFKRSAEKREKWAKIGSKIGGLLFGPVGDYVGEQLGTAWGETRDRGPGVAGSGREDIYGGVGSDQWFQETRKETLQGIDDIGMNAAWEDIKSGNFFGLVGGALGGGKIGIPGGGGKTFGDLSTFLGGNASGGPNMPGGDLFSSFMGDGGGGGGPSAPSFGDFSPDLMGGNYGANMSSGGGGGDSMLGRVMGNVNQQIPEGMDTNTFLVHKQMFPELTPQEAADKYEISLDQYIAQLMNMGKSGMSLGSTGRMGE